MKPPEMPLKLVEIPLTPLGRVCNPLKYPGGSFNPLKTSVTLLEPF